MLVVHPAAAVRPANRIPCAGAQSPARPLGLLRWFVAADAVRRFLQWHAGLARPAHGGWLPARAWRRQSALICLRMADDAEGHR
ncbi:MAG: hypothetical protein K9L70_08900 [Thiohalocapsa sp.]|nr:hypothetical protein [Thiohalocapsa sp.]MCF7992165.1 hypothetical protein [Thiohalocapsa sp.]